MHRDDLPTTSDLIEKTKALGIGGSFRTYLEHPDGVKTIEKEIQDQVRIRMSTSQTDTTLMCLQTARKNFLSMTDNERAKFHKPGRYRKADSGGEGPSTTPLCDIPVDNQHNERLKLINDKLARNVVYCGLCTKKDELVEMIDRVKFVDHYASKHGVIDMYGCPFCNKCYTTKAEYRFHDCDEFKAFMEEEKKTNPRTYQGLFTICVLYIMCTDCGVSRRFEVGKSQEFTSEDVEFFKTHSMDHLLPVVIYSEQIFKNEPVFCVTTAFNADLGIDFSTLDATQDADPSTEASSSSHFNPPNAATCLKCPLCTASSFSSDFQRRHHIFKSHILNGELIYVLNYCLSVRMNERFATTASVMGRTKKGEFDTYSGGSMNQLLGTRITPHIPWSVGRKDIVPVKEGWIEECAPILLKPNKKAPKLWVSCTIFLDEETPKTAELIPSTIKLVDGFEGMKLLEDKQIELPKLLIPVSSKKLIGSREKICFSETHNILLNGKKRIDDHMAKHANDSLYVLSDGIRSAQNRLIKCPLCTRSFCGVTAIQFHLYEFHDRLCMIKSDSEYETAPRKVPCTAGTKAINELLGMNEDGEIIEMIDRTGARKMVKNEPEWSRMSQDHSSSVVVRDEEMPMEEEDDYEAMELDEVSEQQPAAQQNGEQKIVEEEVIDEDNINYLLNSDDKGVRDHHSAEVLSRIKPSDSDILICPNCINQRFTDVKAFYEHLSSHKAHYALEKEDRPLEKTATVWICMSCSTSFEEEKALRTHEETIHLSKDFRHCELCCDYVPLSRYGKHLQQHEKNELKYNCTVCTPNKCFQTDRQLMYHASVKHNISMIFYCKNCSLGSTMFNKTFARHISRCAFQKGLIGPISKHLGVLPSSTFTFQPANIKVYDMKRQLTPEMFGKVSKCKHRTTVRFGKSFDLCVELGCRVVKSSTDGGDVVKMSIHEPSYHELIYKLLEKSKTRPESWDFQRKASFWSDEDYAFLMSQMERARKNPSIIERTNALEASNKTRRDRNTARTENGKKKVEGRKLSKSDTERMLAVYNKTGEYDGRDLASLGHDTVRRNAVRASDVPSTSAASEIPVKRRRVEERVETVIVDSVNASIPNDANPELLANLAREQNDIIQMTAIDRANREREERNRWLQINMAEMQKRKELAETKKKLEEQKARLAEAEDQQRREQAEQAAQQRRLAEDQRQRKQAEQAALAEQQRQTRLVEDQQRREQAEQAAQQRRPAEARQPTVQADSGLPYVPRNVPLVSHLVSHKPAKEEVEEEPPLPSSQLRRLIAQPDQQPTTSQPAPTPQQPPQQPAVTPQSAAPSQQPTRSVKQPPPTPQSSREQPQPTVNVKQQPPPTPQPPPQPPAEQPPRPTVKQQPPASPDAPEPSSQQPAPQPVQQALVRVQPQPAQVLPQQAVQPVPAMRMPDGQMYTQEQYQRFAQQRLIQRHQILQRCVRLTEQQQNSLTPQGRQDYIQYMEGWRQFDAAMQQQMVRQPQLPLGQGPPLPQHIAGMLQQQQQRGSPQQQPQHPGQRQQAPQPMQQPQMAQENVQQQLARLQHLALRQQGHPGQPQQRPGQQQPGGAVPQQRGSPQQPNNIPQIVQQQQIRPGVPLQPVDQAALIRQAQQVMARQGPQAVNQLVGQQNGLPLAMVPPMVVAQQVNQQRRSGPQQPPVAAPQQQRVQQVQQPQLQQQVVPPPGQHRQQPAAAPQQQQGQQAQQQAALLQQQRQQQAVAPQQVAAQRAMQAYAGLTVEEHFYAVNIDRIEREILSNPEPWEVQPSYLRGGVMIVRQIYENVENWAAMFYVMKYRQEGFCFICGQKANENTSTQIQHERMKRLILNLMKHYQRACPEVDANKLNLDVLAYTMVMRLHAGRNRRGRPTVFSACNSHFTDTASLQFRFCLTFAPLPADPQFRDTFGSLQQAWDVSDAANWREMCQELRVLYEKQSGQMCGICMSIEKRDSFHKETFVEVPRNAPRQWKRFLIDELRIIMERANFGEAAIQRNITLLNSRLDERIGFKCCLRHFSPFHFDIVRQNRVNIIRLDVDAVKRPYFNVMDQRPVDWIKTRKGFDKFLQAIITNGTTEWLKDQLGLYRATFKCTECPETILSNTYIVRHQRHKAVNILSCIDCKSNTAILHPVGNDGSIRPEHIEMAVLNHVQSHHRLPEETRNRWDLMCWANECNEQFDNPGQYVNHMLATHNDQFPHISMCRKRFRSPAEMNHHNAQHAVFLPQPTACCVICDAVRPPPHHQLIHTVDITIVCSICAHSETNANTVELKNEYRKHYQQRHVNRDNICTDCNQPNTEHHMDRHWHIEINKGPTEHAVCSNKSRYEDRS